MQPTMCSRCHKHVAVVFITKLEGGQSKNEGLCLKCAKELGIKPIDDMMQKMGITDEDLENLTSEMMSAFGGAEGMEGLMPQDREDGDEDDGAHRHLPLPEPAFRRRRRRWTPSPRRTPPRRPDKNGGKGQERPAKRKFLENYCISLTQQRPGGQAGPAHRPGRGSWSGSSRSSTAARRTTPASSASPAWARPPSPRGWP